MAIYGSFAGQSLLIPGSYSQTTIDLGGSFPLGSRGIVGIFGESQRGKPGSLEDIGSNFYTAEQLSDIVNKYGAGSISDACSMLFSPGNDGALPNGAQYVYIYKTNASLTSSLLMDTKASGLSNYIYFTSNLLGTAGNAITIAWTAGVLSIGVVGNAITVTAANGVTTPAAVIAAIQASPAASALVSVSPQYQPTNAYYTANTISTAAGTLTLANGVDAATTLYSDVYGVDGNFYTVKNVMTNETEATFTSSTAIDLTATPFVVAESFSVQVNGSALNTFTFPAGANTWNTQTQLLGALNTAGNWTTSPATLFTMDATGTAAATILSFKQITVQNHHRDGFGRSMEIKNISGTPLAKMHITAGTALPTEPAALCTIKDTKHNTSTSLTIGGNVALAIGYGDTTATAATVVVGTTTITLTSTGGLTPATVTFTKSQFTTIRDLIAAINILPNWRAASVTNSDVTLPLSSLDQISAIGAISTAGYPTRIKRDAYDFLQFLDVNNSYLNAGTTFLLKGLYDGKVEKFMTGGVIGATLTADITTALSKLEAVRVNAIVPLFSRDATSDIADSLTDTGSTYTISGVHQAVVNHVISMATTTNRSERQAYLSYKNTFISSQSIAYGLNNFRIQLAIQDIKQSSVSVGGLMWYQPWALSCLLAGARMGASVGTPLTHKGFNCAGIRQTSQAMTTDDASIVIDFDPRTQKSAAILAGITFLEKPASGGYRCVVDNTTYSTDSNWYYNRANVVYAGDVYTYDYRTKLENIYVGVKNTVSASSVKSTCASILNTYLNEGITVSTSDAPQGFKNLIVSIVGNTINVSNTVKLVEGIDFVFTTSLIQRASSQA